MPRVRVEPADIEFEAEANESLVEAATRAGYFWPVGCALNGECSNCACEVISGLARLTPMGRYERQNVIRQRGPRAVDDPRLRFACQARVLGDVVVYKRGVERR
ncbi:MAG: 2Fe-2S iron-sulfur cluster-binding protein [Dehalococcoidia bacterium]